MSPEKKVNILLVDDQPGKLLSYEVILGELDQNLIKASSARDALEHLLRTEMAVILIDVCMPELDGFELAAMIREHPRCNQTAIIFVSAVLMTDPDRIRGYGMGAVDYVTVPVLPDVLRAKVNIFVDLYRKTKALEELNQALETRVMERTADLEAANAMLQASETRFRLATEAMPGGIYDWDLQRMRVDRSAGIAAMLGAFPVEGSSDPGWWTELVHPADVAVRSETIEAALQGDARTYGVEYRVRAENEQWIWVWDRGRIVRDDEGGALRVVGHITDVSAQREADELLKEADRRKDEFLAMLAHELRNPLAPIRNSVAVMAQGQVAKKDLDWCLGIIDRQVGHLTRLVDDLLDISRISRNRIELSRSEVDLAEVIESAAETVLSLVQQNEHQFVIAPMDKIVLHADRVRLIQCVSNLLHNAIKFTPKGGSIRISAEEKPPPGPDVPGEVLVRVEDAGVGISPQQLPHIFDMFYQGDTSMNRAQGGLGIGLTLVRRLVELHGGTVEAASRGVGMGSEFRLRLPVTTSKRPHVEPVSAPEPAQTSRRVLVVDDNEDAADSLGLLLSRSGNDVRTASDGMRALEVAEDFRPTVAFLDLGMPTMTGYDLAVRIRSLDWGKDMVLVALTGWGQEDARRRTKEAGFDAHLVKPVDYAALLRFLADVPAAS